MAMLAERENTSGVEQSGNRLLDALDAADLEKINPRLEVSDYASGDLLFDANQTAKFVYFPYSCVASIVNDLDSGSSVEVGTVGNEGFAGISVYLDSGLTQHRTIVQVPGRMARLPAEVFKELAEESPRFRKFLNRSTLAFLAQVSQTAACNRAHNIDQRCARWLLMTHDRVTGDSFSLTHEFLAFMLGVRRAGVTVAAGVLQKAGLITYRRGNINIVNRAGLEDASCECYRVVEREFSKLLKPARLAAV